MTVADILRVSQTRLRSHIGQTTSFFEDNNMKYVMISVALIGATVTASAFAQSNPSNDQTASPALQLASASPADQWVPPYGQPVAGKTRAQVTQELIHAEQDGQMAYLKSLYRGR
jgi:hypothetical protein